MFKIVFYFLLVGADTQQIESPAEFGSHAECMAEMFLAAPNIGFSVHMTAPVQSMYGTCVLAEGSL